MKWIEYIRGKISWQVATVLARGVIDYSEKYLGATVNNFQFLSNGSTIWWRSALTELDKISTSIIEKAKDEEYLKRHKKYFLDFLFKIRKFTEGIRVLNLSELSDKDLIKIHKKLLAIFYPFSGLTFYSIDAMDVKLEELILSKLREFMKIKLKDKFNESLLAKEYGILTTPDELTYVNREELKINELARKKFRGTQLALEARNISNEFWWVPLAWDRIEERNLKDILSKVKECKEPNKNIKNITNRVSTAKKNKEELVKKYSFDAEMRHLLNVFENYAILHDYRKESQMRLVYYLFKINDEISKRKAIDALLLDECYPEEIYKILSSRKVDLDILKVRQKGVFYSINEGKEEIYFGEKALLMIKKELEKHDEELENFSGLVASLGIAAGKAKVCLGAKDAAKKLNKGEILVTGMTTPDFVPYMKIAAAIVTDEGGATSHAAIISREFGIPCIVGTKIGTKVVRDNMIIEVDANHNVVKIIEKNV